MNLTEPQMTLTKMADFRSGEQAADRLRQSRLNAGFASIRDACNANSWPYSTYTNHENGTRGFAWAQARLYGAAFRVDPDWLLTGKVNAELPNNGIITANFHVIRKVPLLRHTDTQSFTRIIMGQIPDAPEGRSEPLPSTVPAGERAFALALPDNALVEAKPFLRENVIGFVDPDAEIKNGDIVAALVKGYPEIVMRKYRLAVSETDQPAFDLVAPDPEFLSFSSQDHEINLIGKLISVNLTL